MITIITGHFVGFLVAIFFFNGVEIVPTASGSSFPVYFALLALLLFVEYQVFRSLKWGKVYFRGSIDESDGSRFTQCQLAYSALGGFCSVIFLQNLLP